MKPSVLAVNNYHHVRGGADRCYLELNRLLAAKGHAVACLSTAHPQNEACPGPHEFVEPIDLRTPGPLDLVRFCHSRRAARAARALVESARPSLAHLHIYYGQLTTSIFAPLREAGIPIVQSLHEFKLVCAVSSLLSNGTPCEACAGRHFWKAAAKRCNRRSLPRSLVSATEAYYSRARGAAEHVDHFLAVSDFVRDKVIQHGLPAHKVTTVHNFVDVEGLEPATGEGEHVLYLGRIERTKGVFTLARAAERLSGLPVLFAGDGEDRAELERTVSERGLEHVRVLGFRAGEELRDLVRRALCVVVPSECHETFGLSALEAMALARPVVASRIGGLPELVSDGEDGFLVTPGDADELAEKLVWLGAHRREAVALGARARADAARRFGAERHYERVLDAYRRVLA